MPVSGEQRMLKERIRMALSAKGKTASDLGEDLNAKKMYQRQILGESLVTYETIYKILYEYHDISPTWLVMGEGPMKRTNEAGPKYYTINHNNNNHDNGIVNIGADVSVNDQVAELRKQLDEVTRDRDLLKNLLAAMTGSGTRK